MILLRTLIESHTIDQIAQTVFAPRALSSLSVPVPLTFLSSASAPSAAARTTSDDD